MVSNRKGVISIFLLIVMGAVLTGALSIAMQLKKTQLKQRLNHHTVNLASWSRDSYSSFIYNHFGILTIPVDDDFVVLLRNHGRIETGIKPEVSLDEKVALGGEVLVEQVVDFSQKVLPIMLVSESVDFKELYKESKVHRSYFDKKNMLDQKVSSLKKSIGSQLIGDEGIDELKQLKREYEALKKEIKGYKGQLFDLEVVVEQMDLSLSIVEKVIECGVFYEEKSIDPLMIPKVKTTSEKKYSRTIAELRDKEVLDLAPYESLLLDAYATSVFKMAFQHLSYDMPYGSRDERKGVLEGEVEYLVVGKKGDSENIQGVKVRMIALRSLLNTVALLSDGEVMGYFSQLASTGVTGMVVSSGLFATYVIYESTEDYNVLIEGGKVPIFKIREDFHFKLFDSEGDSIERGLFYGDYLRGLLALTDDSDKVNRIAHLIKCNHQLIVDGKKEYLVSFNLIADYDGLLKKVVVDVWE